MKNAGIERSISGGNSGYTFRFILTVRGRNFNLVNARKIESVSLPSDTGQNSLNYSGSWIELRNATGKILYSRSLHHPFVNSVEVVGGSEETEFKWHTVEDLEKTIVLRVPEMDGSDHVAVMFMDPVSKEEKATELVRLSVNL